MPLRAAGVSLFTTLGLAAVYYATAALGFTWASSGAQQVTLVWPPAGISLAALLLLGFRVWPGVALGALLANAMRGEPFLTACGIAMGNTLEAVLGAWLLRRSGYRGPPLFLRHAVALLVLCAGLSTTISATLGVTSLCLGKVQPWESFGTLWLTWWVGDSMGDILVAPAILAWAGAPWRRLRPARAAELACQLAALLVVALLVFEGRFGSWPHRPTLEYAVFPFLIWGALRFGERGATLGNLLLASLAILGTARGSGPFAVGNVEQNLLLLQTYMGVAAGTGLLLAAALAERRAAERSLRAESGLRRAIENSVLAGIAAVDLEGRQTYVNPAFCRLVGWSESELIGASPPFVYWAEGERQTIERALETALRGEAPPGGFPLPFRHRSGRRIDVLLQVAPLLESDGKLGGWLVSVADITEERRMAEALERSETRYRSLVLASTQIVWTANAAGEVVEDLPTWRAFTGQSQEEMKGSGWMARVHPEDLPRTRQVWADSLASGKPHTNEFRLLRHDGEWRRVLARAVPVLGPEGKVREWVGTCTDITQEKVAQEERQRLLEQAQAAHAAAEAARKRSDLVAEVSAILVSSPDPESTLEDVLRRALPLLGQGAALALLDEEGKVKGLALAHTDPSREEELGRLAALASRRMEGKRGPRLLSTGGPVPDRAGAGEAELLGRLGARRAVAVPVRAREQSLGLLLVLPAESGGGDPGAELRLVEDVARRVALALDNARLYGEAHRENRLKDQFLAMLAHELRNPLAPILNSAQILLRRFAGDPQLEQVARMVERQGLHMARLLDDLLDVSRISRGRIELRRESLDLREAVERALEFSRPAREARKQELKVSFPPEPLRLWADAVRLEQVILNLLQNASKFTPDGGRIEISGAREGMEVVLRVTDSGRGIARGMLRRIFDLFVQETSSLDPSQGGLGIGLTIVRSLVEMHGGTVRAESAGEGKGSTFIVRLPLMPALPAAAAAAAPGGKTRAPGAGPALDVLVVDDNADGAESLAALLCLLGHRVKVAADGPQALQRAREAPPQAVLLDIGLPGMDGYRVARALRCLPGMAGALLVAISGYGQEADRRRSLEAGCQDHLIKPVDIERLSEVLATLAVPPRPPREAPPSADGSVQTAHRT